MFSTYMVAGSVGCLEEREEDKSNATNSVHSALHSIVAINQYRHSFISRTWFMVVSACLSS